MEWFWILVATAGAGLATTWWRTRRATHHAEREAFGTLHRLVDEDVVRLGEELERLDPGRQARVLDEDVRSAHRAAAEAFESARRAVTQATAAEEISRVTAAVATGRNALVVLEARPAGGPVPEHRLMCFFDPQHGPSSGDVVWTRPGHGERRVPACARDAERVAGGQQPAIRLVEVGARRTPYWAAGDAFRPYTRGYFASAPALAWAFEPEVPDAAAGRPTPGHLGSGVVGSSGHFDGGGFDGSGAPPD